MFQLRGRGADSGHHPLTDERKHYVNWNTQGKVAKLKGDAETQLDELFHGPGRGSHARLVWQPFLGYSN